MVELLTSKAIAEHSKFSANRPMDELGVGQGECPLKYILKYIYNTSLRRIQGDSGIVNMW